MSLFAPPKLPKLKPPAGADGALGVASALSAGFAPERLPPTRAPPDGGAGAATDAEACVAPDDVAGLDAAKREMGAAAAGFSAGLAPNENKVPGAGGADAGVVLPAATPFLPKRPAAGAGVPGVADAVFEPNNPLGAAAAFSAGLAPKRPVDGAEAFSAGFAPKRFPPAGGADGVDVPLPPPNNPAPAGLAPNSEAPALAGGGAAGVVDPLNPPKRGLDAGVVEPAAGVEDAAPKPKEGAEVPVGFAVCPLAC